MITVKLIIRVAKKLEEEFQHHLQQDGLDKVNLSRRLDTLNWSGAPEELEKLCNGGLDTWSSTLHPEDYALISICVGSENPLLKVEGSPDAYGLSVTSDILDATDPKLWSVLLMVPDWAAPNQYGEDTFFTHVVAETPHEAVAAARSDARIAYDLDDDDNEKDFTAILVLAGKHFDETPSEFKE